MRLVELSSDRWAIVDDNIDADIDLVYQNNSYYFINLDNNFKSEYFEKKEVAIDTYINKQIKWKLYEE